MHSFDYLNSYNLEYIEELFFAYQKNPSHIDSTWRYFFDGMTIGFEPVLSSSTDVDFLVKKFIEHFRRYGHFSAKINPLFQENQKVPFLDADFFSLKLNQKIEKPFWNLQEVSLIVEKLKKTYCESIGVEFPDALDEKKYLWLANHLEQEYVFSVEQRRKIAQSLMAAESFEKFLHTRYVAQKRFSLEGAEALIPLLESAFLEFVSLEVQEVIIGMAHRGRLNVLKNIFKKPSAEILLGFEGFEFNHLLQAGIQGDVKYHLGYSSDIEVQEGKKLHLSLAFNPSHLEAVNPVVLGMAYAKQKSNVNRIVPLLIHGDAAMAGQGICYEVLNLSKLSGYTVGGVLHIVINNQIGFTAQPHETRSTKYCTDLLRGFDIPVLHVNADDPEAVWRAAKIAAGYRQTFKSDICIDLIGYRKHGHNESDEPSFTQPYLYQKIKAHPSCADQYLKKYFPEDTALKQYAEQMQQELLSAQTHVKEKKVSISYPTLQGVWKNIQPAHIQEMLRPIKTTVDKKTLDMLIQKIHEVPQNFGLHPKLQKLFEQRVKSFIENTGFEWAVGELLAYATLLWEKIPVRLSGQDVQRGTFSHRQAVLHDQQAVANIFIPLQNLFSTQAPFEIFNSHLSEAAVLGFDFGIASADPYRLVVWEAQFGDFANGAQVIIDQFLSSSETKWQRMNGLTLFLPHGYEGQGPEHSSGRIERFLQLSAQGNWFICNLTTPAQIFHCLRRQALAPYRKPLIIFTPKSLLRNPLAISKVEDLSSDSFHEVYPALTSTPHSEVKKILLCSGKIFYDLFEKQQKNTSYKVAIIRIEQLYPLHKEKLLQLLQQYPHATQIVWVQEEPKNMGAWWYMQSQWREQGLADAMRGKILEVVARESSSSPAVGYSKAHEAEQQFLLTKAFE